MAGPVTDAALKVDCTLSEGRREWGEGGTEGREEGVGAGVSKGVAGTEVVSASSPS